MANLLKTHPLASVDSQVLYRQFQPLDGETLYGFIVEAVKSIGIATEDCELLSAATDPDICVRCGDYQVLVTQSVPFAEDDYLQVALDTFSFETSFKGMPAVDEAITACTHVSVQKDCRQHLDTDAKDLRLVENDGSSFDDSRECLRAMELTKEVTARIVDKTDADSVFWGPSTFLLDPEAFRRLASAKNPLSLYLHCHVYSQVEPSSGERLAGVIASGAQWLIGSTVEFKPSPLPPEYLVEKIYEFVRFSLKNGRKITSGDVFGKDETETVQVIVHQSGGSGPECVELKVVHNPDLGIVRETISKDAGQLDANCHEETLNGPHQDGETLDPCDPVDSAILDRLHELNTGKSSGTPDPSAQTVLSASHDASSPGTTPSSASSHQNETFEGTPVQEDPSRPVQEPEQSSGRKARASHRSARRMSMAELRDFAKEAQVPLPIREEPRKKSGLFGKFFGKKAN